LNSPNNLQRGSRLGGSSLNGRERGYAYVMALFMVLTVIVSSQVLLRNMVTETRSQREEEMIWRGNQYVRAIKMYYRKTGHFPQTQDDLLTGVPDLHFLRSEALTDPMNKQDGNWRFIYTVSSTGVIIGSVKYGTLQQMAFMDMNGGQMPGAQPGQGTSGSTDSSGDNSSTGTNGSGSTTNGSTTSTGATGTGPNGGLNGSPVANQPGGAGVTNGPAGALGVQSLGVQTAQAQPTGPVDSPVLGGVIIGVGSTVDATSIKTYKGGTKYNQWEFIWNPLEEQAQAVQQGINQAGAGGGLGLPGLPLGPVLGPGSPGGPSGSSGSSGNSGGSNNPGAPNNPPSSD